MPVAFAKRVSLLPIAVFGNQDNNRRRSRHNTFPLSSSSRKKDRRWPLVLRFWKGSIHGRIAFPVVLHAILAAFIVYVNQHINSDFNLPSSIIPSLSIVVGLMLVFRNQTAYSRFWGGRCHLNIVTTAIRCITRQILVLVPPPEMSGLHSVVSSDSMLPHTLHSRTQSSMSTTRDSNLNDVERSLSKFEELRTIETVKILIAMLYTIKNHLRAEWGVALSPGTSLTADGQEATHEEYKDLLPVGLKGYEHRGLGLTLELATFVEKFITDGVKKKWFHNAASSRMLSSLDDLIKAYGSMEVIRLVPIPVAHLIHHKQTLALFCGIMPFAMCSEMDWWAVPLTAFVAFTLYGIEGIAATYEDPFGVEKIDINMDDIVDDARREVEVLLTAWQTQGSSSGGIFRPRVGDVSKSDNSSEYYSDLLDSASDTLFRADSSRDNLGRRGRGLGRDGDEMENDDGSGSATPLGSRQASDLRSQVRFVVSEASEDADEEDELMRARMQSVVSPGTMTDTSEYFST